MKRLLVLGLIAATLVCMSLLIGNGCYKVFTWDSSVVVHFGSLIVAGVAFFAIARRCRDSDARAIMQIWFGLAAILTGATAISIFVALRALNTGIIGSPDDWVAYVTYLIFGVWIGLRTRTTTEALLLTLLGTFLAITTPFRLYDLCQPCVIKSGLGLLVGPALTFGGLLFARFHRNHERSVTVKLIRGSLFRARPDSADQQGS